MIEIIINFITDSPVPKKTKNSTQYNIIIKTNTTSEETTIPMLP